MYSIVSKFVSRGGQFQFIFSVSTNMFGGLWMFSFGKSCPAILEIWPQVWPPHFNDSRPVQDIASAIFRRFWRKIEDLSSSLEMKGIILQILRSYGHNIQPHNEFEIVHRYNYIFYKWLKLAVDWLNSYNYEFRNL